MRNIEIAILLVCLAGFGLGAAEMPQAGQAAPTFALPSQDEPQSIYTSFTASGWCCTSTPKI